VKVRAEVVSDFDTSQHVLLYIHYETPTYLTPPTPPVGDCPPSSLPPSSLFFNRQLQPLPLAAANWVTNVTSAPWTAGDAASDPMAWDPVSSVGNLFAVPDGWVYQKLRPRLGGNNNPLYNSSAYAMLAMWKALAPGLQDTQSPLVLQDSTSDYQWAVEGVWGPQASLTDPPLYTGSTFDRGQSPTTTLWDTIASTGHGPCSWPTIECGADCTPGADSPITGM
jgi:hypothetical protein